MYRKLVLLLGAAAIIASLMMPPTKTYTVNTGEISSWSGRPVTSEATETNYELLTTRTLSIFVGAAVLFFLVPVPNKK